MVWASFPGSSVSHWPQRPGSLLISHSPTPNPQPDKSTLVESRPQPTLLTLQFVLWNSGCKVGMQIKTASINCNGARQAKNGRLTGMQKYWRMGYLWQSGEPLSYRAQRLCYLWQSGEPITQGQAWCFDTIWLFPCYKGLGMADPKCSQRMWKLRF